MPTDAAGHDPGAPRDHGPLSVRVVSDRGEFAAMAREWNALLAASDADVPFLTHQWVSAWLEVYGRDAGLFALAAEDAAGLAGIVPLYRERRPTLAGEATVLRFLGDRDCGADFLGVILRPDREEEVAAALAGRLARDPAWHVLILDHADARSRSLALFSDGLRRAGVRPSLAFRNVCPHMILPDTFPAFLEMPDRVFKRIIAKDQARFAKKHRMRYLPDAAAAGLDAVLDRLFALHVERFEAGGGHGTLGDPGRQAFYRAVARSFHGRGWLKLTAIEIEGAIEAVDFGFLYHGAYSSLQGGISRAGLALKAGNIQTLAILADIVGAAREFHYLRGEELYKYQWGCESLATQRLSAFRGRPGRAFGLARAARDAVKIVKRAIRPHPGDGSEKSHGKPSSTVGGVSSAGVSGGGTGEPRARWVTEVGEWRDMARSWDGLATAAAPDNPFLTHDWLMAWWEVYGAGRKLALAVVEDENGPVGAAPLWSGRRGQTGVSLRALSYLGGDFGGAEYLDVLVPAGREKPFFGALGRLLAASGHHRLCLERHDAASRGHIFLKAALADRPMIFQTGLGYAYPCLTLPGTLRDFEASPPAAWAAKGEETGRIRILPDIPADRRQEALSRLCDLHQARAVRRGEPGAFADPRKMTFFMALVERLAGTGRLRLSGVLADGEFAAVEIGVGSGTAHFALESGLSPEAERLGLDRLLTGGLLRSLVGRAASYTCLADHDPGLFGLGARMRPTLRLDAFFGARGRAAAALKAVAGFGRQALGRVRGG